MCCLSYFLIAVVAVIVFRFVFNKANAVQKTKARTAYDYDVIVIGGSIAGPYVSKALAKQGRKVLMVERSLWAKPDRIVGELLQPGGIEALKDLGMEQCALKTGMPADGYAVQNDDGTWVPLPFKEGYQGVSFHFGDFVQNLRRNVWDTCKNNVEMVQGVVTDVLTETVCGEERAYGISYTRAKKYAVPEEPFLLDGEYPPEEDSGRETIKATAPLVIMCDGGSSKFKSRYSHYRPAGRNHSHFVGLIAKDAEMAYERRGNVFLGKTGPILAYRLDAGEVRVLADYKADDLPRPEVLQKWLIEEVAPRMNAGMAKSVIEAAQDKKNIRSMPIAQYKATTPSMNGVIGIGDNANQRHPLTGGGMTCAFRDGYALAQALAKIPDLRVQDPVKMVEVEAAIKAAILSYTRCRYLHSSCINILSWALYAVFSNFMMRTACFDYFLLGGDCVSGPMELLAGLNPSPATLLRHYSRVAANGAYNVITLSGSYAGKNPDGTIKTPTAEEKKKNAINFFLSPSRILKAEYMLAYAVYVFAPLIVRELLSIWRVFDPTDAFATKIYRPAEAAVVRAILRNGGRPVSV